MSRPAKPGQPVNTFHYWLRDGDWDLLGQARGDVVAPAGLVHLQKLQYLELLDFMSGAGFSARGLSDFRASMPYLGLYRDFEKKQELRND